MSSTKREKIKSIFNIATELETSKRESFLKVACGEDFELRREIENLLASFDEADSFLEDSAVGEVASLIIEKTRKLEKGQTVGFYEIISNIGTGGMGEVYLANDSRLNRRIALKILPAEFTRDEMRLKRFRLEAQTASALNHPNIITIYEIGDFEETNYIATEYVEGETLREKLSNSHLQPPEVLDIAVQIASGLAVAHRANVVHRDIKPENIMIRPDGIVKILDFGLAKLQEMEKGRKEVEENSLSQNLTNPGTIMGTVNYMSPEQADGSKIDGRTDLWSMGVCLFEIFTGKLPFSGKTLNHTLVAIMESEPREFEPINSFESAEVKQVICKLLRKSPHNRYQSAEQVAEDLRRIKRHLQNIAKEKETVPKKKTIEEKPLVRSIAVLPFLTFGLREDEEYLGIGLADSLIMQLSKAKELEVRPTNAVRNFTDTERDINEIGRKLKVGSVLEGNLQKLGERLRVSVQLIGTNSQKTIWADKFNADLMDLFDLQDMIAEKVSESLLLSLNTIEQEKFSKPPTDSKAAYLEYLKGRYYWDKRNVEAVKQAVEQFKKAIDLDPTYALAYTGLADAYTMLGIWGEFPPDEIFPRARAAAERALQIDENLAEAYASISRVKYSYEKDWEGVESSLKKAIELNPNYSAAYGRLGTFYSLMHRHDETVKVLEIARKLDPLSRQTASSLAASYYFARKFETAVEKLKAVLAIHPNYLSAVFMLAVSYARSDQFADAIETGKRAVELSNGHLVIKSYLAIIYILAGEKEKGLKILSELEEKVSENKTLTYSIAAIYAQLNEKEKAYEWLEKCFEKGDANIHSIAIDIEFDSLRGDERFNEMLERLGLYQIADENRKNLETGKSSETSDIKSLAVLPFATVGLNADEEYLGLGLADALITHFSRSKQIAVRPTSMVRDFENAKTDSIQIGKKLRVDSILEGNVQKVGERIRVTVQLVDLKSENSLWAEKFLFDFTDIFEVQDEISRMVSHSLLQNLSGEKKIKIKTSEFENTESYKEYLRGIFYLHKQNPEDLRKAVDYFRKAIELSPNSAEAYAGLAEAYIFSSYLTAAAQKELPKAKIAAQRAIELNPDSVEAKVSLGTVYIHYDWNWSEAEIQLKDALKINPKYERAYRYYGVLQGTLRRFDKAILFYREGLSLNPVSMELNTYLGLTYALKGETEMAIEQCKKTLELHPNCFPAKSFLGLSYLFRELYEKAIETFEESIKMFPHSPISHANIGHAFAVSGNEAAARKTLLRLKKFKEKGYIPHIYPALIHIGLNEKEKALDHLEKAFENREVIFANSINTDPRYLVLKDEPRYIKLLKEVGF